MTQEQKDKLLKYLCMALPYEVKVSDSMGRTSILTLGNVDLCSMFYGEAFDQGNTPSICKPYLRPMSSITSQELGEFYKTIGKINNVVWVVPTPDWSFTIKGIDWLLKYHFDFMGLISTDCAIEVTDKNNPYKN